MCGFPDHLVSSGECQIGGYAISDGGAKSKLSDAKGMCESSISLLEFAANNDLEGFKRAVENGGKVVEDCGSWYCRKYGTNEMRWSQRTPAMIASLYGCKEVLKYILTHVSGHGGDANKGCDSDGVTALHCAAAGGSPHVVDIVNLLLSNGADPSSMDAQGLQPLDVMRVSASIPHLKTTMEKLLNGSLKLGSPHSQGFSTSSLALDAGGLSGSLFSPKIVAAKLENKIGLELGDNTCDVYPMSPLSLASFSSSPVAGGFFPSLASSPKSRDASSIKVPSDASEKKDSPADPSMIVDIKNSIYTTDEFRMFSFKVCPCSRAYSHDWTECPFVHPGENARRRDPRKYHYSCVSCPDFRKGACRHGDACEYAHGVFECWLHPAQYRTRLCKDGISCSRRVCFFAHTTEELRPLYVSTGSAVPSSRTISSLDVTSMSPPLGSTSPSSIVTLPPFTQLNTEQSGLSPTTSPLSTNSSISNWIHPSLSTVNLSGVCFQSSRLKAAASARDVYLEDLGRPSGLEEQLMSEVTSLSTRARLNAAVAASGCGTTSSRAGKLWNMGPSVAPTNLEDLFASEVVLSPVTPSQVSLQSRVDTQMQSNKSVHSPYHFKPLQSGSQVMSSTFKQMEGSKGTPLSPAVLAARSILAQRDKRCHSSKDLGVGLSWSDWGSPTGKPEWSVHTDDLSKLRKSASFGLTTTEEPDVSWVQQLLKDGPLDGDLTPSGYSVEMGCSGLRDVTDHSVLGSWMEQRQLDQIVA